MKRKIFISILLLVGVVILQTGCGSPDAAPAAGTEPTSAISEAPTSTPKPKPTSTPRPTATPEPTDTPAPIFTPAPTDTPEPTSTPEPELLVIVSDDESGDPIAGAQVELSNEEMGAVFNRETDDEGQAVFTTIPAGEFALSVSAAGYYDETDEEVVVSGPAEMACPMTRLATAEIGIEGATLHSGPGHAFGHEGEIEEGETVEIVNQNEAGSWFLVAFGEEGETAWLDGEDVTVSGGIDRVEPVESPPTPTPAPTVIAPTATPETTDTMVLYYRSNPSEVLGVFPVRPFDPAAALNHMRNIRASLYTMRDALGGAQAGDAAACSAYVNAYNNILYSGVYYDPVPPEWEDIDFAYYISFVYALDRTRPAYLSCANAGNVDSFNASLASMAIEETLAVLNPAIDSAASRL